MQIAQGWENFPTGGIGLLDNPDRQRLRSYNFAPVL
jgi:hypothetical protein